MLNAAVATYVTLVSSWFWHVILNLTIVVEWNELPLGSATHGRPPLPPCNMGSGNWAVFTKNAAFEFFVFVSLSCERYLLINNQKF